nr:hypothetical protein [Tanacetum cinerariifolium]
MTTRKPEVDARERLAAKQECAVKEREKAVRKSETETETEAAAHVNSEGSTFIAETAYCLDRMVLSDAPVSVTKVFLFWRSSECSLLSSGISFLQQGELSLLAVGTSSSSGKSSLEYSVAKTPQQNEVAERRNRTLIEAARTMALVTKPHNMTPYELIHGRPPLIDFMKPFGCPVIMLNIKDNLGKFNGKTNEGYFVWYSVDNWLFDIDSLTISMNYVPVVTGNQTNGIAGSKENLVAGTKDNAEDDGKKVGEGNASEASDNGGHDYQVPRSEIEILLQQERWTAHNNSTNGINTISSPVSIVGPSFVNTASPSPINDVGPSARTNAFEVHSFEQFSPFKNAFSLLHVPMVTPIDDTEIFSNAYDDDVLEEEVDINNVDSSYTIPRATKNKKDERGIVIKNKARLVAQEHTQEEGIDYDEVFAPVARIEAIRLFLAYDSFKDFVVYQMYIKNSPFDLEAYSDSDHARASLDRKSIIEGCQFFDKRLMIAKDMRCFMDTSEVTTGNPLLNTARLMLILLVDVHRQTTIVVAVERRYSHHSRTLWCRAVMAQPLVKNRGGVQPSETTTAVVAKPAKTTTAAPWWCRACGGDSSIVK